MKLNDILQDLLEDYCSKTNQRGYLLLSLGLSDTSFKQVFLKLYRKVLLV